MTALAVLLAYSDSDFIVFLLIFLLYLCIFFHFVLLCFCFVFVLPSGVIKNDDCTVEATDRKHRAASL